MKLLNLSNWVQSLIESFTFYGGGGSKGGGSSQTTNQLDPTVRPFVEFGLNEAKDLYQTSSPEYFGGQTYIGPFAQTTQALDLAGQRALAGSPLLPAAQQRQYII
jgi:hypothetical protein